MASAVPSVVTNDLTIALDMLQNFNFSQVSDAIKNFSANPVTAVEDVANVAVQAAAVAGVPFAGTAEEFLPMAENFLNMALPFMNLFGGASGAAAKAATAISSPPTLTPQKLTTK